MENQSQSNNKGNTYYQKDMGIGHMDRSQIKDNAKVAGTIYESDQKNLAEAAKEIEALLTQLSAKYSNASMAEQMQAGVRIVQQIENDPTLKQRAIAAFKGGLLEFLKTTPIGAPVAGAIEGWSNA